MRKILAIVLLLVFGLPTALPLFAAGRDHAGLPACCRRSGKHHCGMDEMADVASAPGARTRGVREVRAAGEVCPYRCALVTRGHAESGTAAICAMAFYAAVVAHPAVQAQAESRWRVARERSRGKRGPPAGTKIRAS